MSSWLVKPKIKLKEKQHTEKPVRHMTKGLIVSNILILKTVENWAKIMDR